MRSGAKGEAQCRAQLASAVADSGRRTDTLSSAGPPAPHRGDKELYGPDARSRSTATELQATLLRQRAMVDESHLNLSIHL